MSAENDSKENAAAGAPSPAEKSFGAMSAHHWSRARAGSNAEALEYYRSRSQAPGVAAGGTERNFYCMRCEGVIPFDHAGSSCPHCGESLAEMAKRYFNWVEINEPPRSDLRALLPIACGVVAAVCVLAFFVWYITRP